MGTEVYPKIIGPPSMPSGFASLPPGSGVDEWILVRDDADGVVVNAETLSQKASSNGKLVDGIIDVSHVPILGCHMQAEFGTGPLTEVSVTPVWLDRPNGFASYDAVGTLAGNIITLTKKLYRVSTEIPYFFTVQNPGANYVKFYFSSTGTTTGSYVIFAVGLGWGSGNKLSGVS